MTVTIENTNVDTALNIAELTTASLTGTGVFDVLLQTLRLHLDREFTSGRITGTAYATVYSQALTAVLQQSVGFCLSKAKLALELQQMQEQVVLLQKQQDQITATIRQTDYITDYQLPADLATKNKQLALLDYDLVNIKPAELAIAQQDILLKTAQAALTSYDLTTIKPQELALLTQKVANETYIVQHRLPAEVADIEAGVALKDYELTDVQPAQVAQVVAQTSHVTKQELSTIQQTANLVTEQANMVKQGALVDSQKIVADKQALSITADTSLKAYELTDIKPTQKAQIVAETSHVTKQELNTVQQTLNLGSQQAQIETETDRILYEITNKLPEEVQLIKLNQDQLIAQNNKIATDTVVTIKQGHLTDAQTCQVTAQTNQVNAEVALKLPEEVELVKRNQTMLTTQIAQVNAETTLKLPEEVELIKRNQASVTAQAAQVTAQTSLLAYDLATTKPIETDNLTITGVNLTKQGGLLDSQKVVADNQALNVTAETTQINYRTNYQIPEEVKVIKYNQDMLVAQAYKVSVDTIVASKQGALLDAQVCEVKASANKTNAEVALKLPEEVEILKRNQTQLTSQIAEIDYRTTTLMPSQTTQTTAQTAQVTYTTANLLPAQVALTTAQTDNADAQVAQVTAQTAQVTYTTANLLPAQVTNTTAQTANTTAQTDLYAQKKVTELAQTTNTPAATSVMGVQNALMEQQRLQYLRDAEQKAAKIMIETWAVRQNTDGGQVVTTNHLGDTYIATAVDALLAGI